MKPLLATPTASFIPAQGRAKRRPGCVSQNNHRALKARFIIHLSKFALLYAIMMLGAATSMFAATDPAAQFDAANKLFEQGKFSEAAAAYQKIADTGRVSSVLYFNWGNALFKSGQTGRALAAYRQAEQLAPRDPDIRANLQFVRDQIQGPTLPPERWHRWLGGLTLNEWTATAAAVLWLWLLSLAAVQLRPAWKPALRGFNVIASLAVLAMSICVGFVLENSSRPMVVVTAQDVVVHNGPLDESPAAFTAHDGAEMAVLDRKDDWLQVTAGPRRIGWLKRDQAVPAPNS